tara:strand:- start:5594 stop:6694 length:1101 start_codon:yes stop_codon:yes gene_type:complete
MSTGKTNITSTQFAAKKLLGKAHTSNLKSDVNESVPSNVSMPFESIFGESIPNDPGTDFYTVYGTPGTVEQVYFDVVSISDTIYDADDTGGGGDESSTSGPHGYYLKLPAAYETTSSNPSRGTGEFTNGKRVYDSRGGLQLVPPLVSNASPNRYFLKLYKGDPTDPANEITSGDSVDWQVDYYSGIIFIQDYNSARVPVTASAYLYVGKYLDERIVQISGSGGGGSGAGIFTEIDNNEAFVTSSLTIGANTNPTHTLTLVGNSHLSGGISHKRHHTTENYTVTLSDYYIGVDTNSSQVTLTLPSAGSTTSGQTFVVKDEGGNAGTNNITVHIAGSDTIDGGHSVVLESAYAAVSIYSNGLSGYFVY